MMRSLIRDLSGAWRLWPSSPPRYSLAISRYRLESAIYFVPRNWRKLVPAMITPMVAILESFHQSGKDRDGTGVLDRVPP